MKRLNVNLTETSFPAHVHILVPNVRGVGPQSEEYVAKMERQRLLTATVREFLRMTGCQNEDEARSYVKMADLDLEAAVLQYREDANWEACNKGLKKGK